MTVFLPVRSSLYAVFPSVGFALAGAALITSAWVRSSSRQRTRMISLGLITAFCTLPIYWQRNDKWIQWAELSTETLQAIAPLAATVPENRAVLLRDDRTTRINLVSAFGSLIETAVRLQTGRNLQIWIEPPPRHWQQSGLVRPETRHIAVQLMVSDGRVVGGARGP